VAVEGAELELQAGRALVKHKRARANAAGAEGDGQDCLGICGQLPVCVDFQRQVAGAGVKNDIDEPELALFAEAIGRVEGEEDQGLFVLGEITLFPVSLSVCMY
jgi:hypothetical protein